MVPMTSRIFGKKRPQLPHLVNRGGGLSGELFDLRSDIDEAFDELEGSGTLGDSVALSQAAWYINATTGDDDNDGLTSATALKTMGEYSRRTGDKVTGALGGVFIYLETDIVEDVTLRGHYLQALFLQGTRTVVGTGSVTAKQDWDGPTSVDGQITDAALPVSWTASGFVGQMIVLTSGANAGAVAWIAKDLGAKTARHSPFTRCYQDTVHPDIGNTYEIVQLTKITGQTTVAVAGIGTLAYDVEFVPTVGLGTPNFHVVNGGLTLSSCKVSGPGYSLVEGGQILSAYGSALIHPDNCYAFSGSKLELHQTLVGNKLLCSRSGVVKVHDCIAQYGFGATSIGIGPYGNYGGVQVYGFFAVYDQPGATSFTIRLDEFATLLLKGKVFGTGNAGFGLWVGAGSKAIYPTGTDFTTHYDVTTTGVEVRYGEVDTTYAGVGLLGVVNLSNLAMIVPSE